MRECGGVATYVDASIPVKVIQELHADNFETLWLLLRPKNLPRKFSPLLVVNVYHPDHNKPATYHEELEKHLIDGLDYILEKHHSAGIIVTGDFNHFKSKYNWTTAFKLKQLVNQPTRKDRILDLFFTNMAEMYTKLQVFENIGGSDHNGILVTPIFKPESIKPSFVIKRHQPNRNKHRFIESIQATNWNDILLTTTSLDKFKRFNDRFMAIVNEHLPWKKILRPADTKPWVTEQFIEAINLRNKYWFKDRDGIMFKYYRNKVSKMKINLRSKYVEKQMAACKDSKQWWSTIKSITGTTKNEQLVSMVNDLFDGDTTKFVNAANDFFISVAKDIKPLDKSKLPELSSNYSVPDKFLPNVDDVQKLMSGIKLTKATGPDTIPNWIWKDCNNTLAAPITSIVCESMRDGMWPNEWRCADVLPLKKISHPTKIETDLRPVGLTSVISKVVGEEIMVKHLWSFIKNKIDSNQFGVVKGGSTVIAMIKLIHNLLEAADKHLSSRILLVDFSKAFDRIDHTLLLKKLIEMEVPIWLCNWIAGFLTDRKQRVRYNGHFSSWRNIPNGVPQGTKFGPIGFIVLVNSMLADIKFVDDSTLIENLGNTNMSTLALRGQRLADWASEHKMKLNATKTNEMRVCFKRSPQVWDPVIINGTQIQPVNSAKILGFHINNKLTWDNHIEHIISEANKRLYLLRAMKNAKFTKDIMLTFYQATIRSVLEYGAQVWSFNITINQNDAIERIQRRALKMIDGIPPLDHNYDYSALLSKYNTKSLKDRRTQLCKSLFEKIIKDQDHPLRVLYSSKPQNRTRSTAHFNIPSMNTERFCKSFVPSSILEFQ